MRPCGPWLLKNPYSEEHQREWWSAASDPSASIEGDALIIQAAQALQAVSAKLLIVRHYKRVFSELADVPLAQRASYVRKRMVVVDAAGEWREADGALVRGHRILINARVRAEDQDPDMGRDTTFVFDMDSLPKLPLPPGTDSLPDLVPTVSCCISEYRRGENEQMPHGVWFVIHMDLDLDGVYFLMCRVLTRPLTDRPERVIRECELMLALVPRAALTEDMFRTLRFGPGDPE